MTEMVLSWFIKKSAATPQTEMDTALARKANLEKRR
jgi:phage-related protein